MCHTCARAYKFATPVRLIQLCVCALSSDGMKCSGQTQNIAYVYQFPTRNPAYSVRLKVCARLIVDLNDLSIMSKNAFTCVVACVVMCMPCSTIARFSSVKLRVYSTSCYIFP